MGVAGVDFDTAWRGRVESTYGGVPVDILGREALIRTKEATGRLQDQLDLEKLRAAKDDESP